MTAQVKIGRPALPPEQKKRTISRKVSPVVELFLKSISTQEMEDILRRSKAFRDWKRG